MTPEQETSRSWPTPWETGAFGIYRVRPLFVATLIVALFTGCGGVRKEHSIAPAPDVLAGSGGVAVLLPPGWATSPPNDGPVIDPVTRLAAASGPIEPASTGCSIAAYAFPSDAVAIVLVEWKDPDGNPPPRPDRFSTNFLPLRDPPTIECFEGRGAAADFTDHGRIFAAYILLGPRAPDRLADQARRVLDTLRVR